VHVIGSPRRPAFSYCQPQNSGARRLSTMHHQNLGVKVEYGIQIFPQCAIMNEIDILVRTCIIFTVLAQALRQNFYSIPSTEDFFDDFFRNKRRQNSSRDCYEHAMVLKNLSTNHRRKRTQETISWRHKELEHRETWNEQRY